MGRQQGQKRASRKSWRQGVPPLEMSIFFQRARTVSNVTCLKYWSTQSWFSALNVWGTMSQKSFQLWLNFQIMHYKHVAETNVFPTLMLFFCLHFGFVFHQKYVSGLDNILGSESMTMLWASPHGLDDCLCILHIVWEMLVPSCFLSATLESSGKVGCMREPGFC